MAFKNYVKCCPDCGKPFRRMRALKRHVDGWTRTAHSKWVLNKETNVREKVIIPAREFPACEDISKAA